MSYQVNLLVLMFALIAGSSALPARAENNIGIVPRYERQFLHDDFAPPVKDPHLLGIGLRYQELYGWGVELAYLRGHAAGEGGGLDIDPEVLRVDLSYSLRSRDGLTPFFLFGGGKQRFNYDTYETYDTAYFENDMLHVGLGLDAAISQKASFKVEVRATRDMENEWISGVIDIGWAFSIWPL